MGDRSGNKIGQQFGNYYLVRLLGQGGFAEVYLGEHTYLKAQAAIKVLHTQLAKQDMESFLAEARTIARLRHPYIIGVLEFGVENGAPFLVMDYAPNGTLKQRHPRGTLVPPTIIVPHIKQVAEALQYAHEQNFIHRDIKPENMLLGPNNEVLLSDFGLAMIAQSSLDQEQKVAGTVAYMAPEQLQGRPGRASDQYALAVVVYEWLTGDVPFHGRLVQVAGQHVLAPPPSLREQVPTISLAVEQVVLTALAKDPQQRFVSVQAFADALEQASRADTAAVLTPPSAPGLSPTASSPGSKTLPEEQGFEGVALLPPLSSKAQPRPGLFWKVPALLGALVLLLIGGSLTYYTLALQPNQLSRQATAMAQAQQQQTAARSVSATATLQADSKSTVTARMQATAQVQATAVALQALYIQSTSGSPVLNDPLNAQDQYKWDEATVQGGSCTFKGGVYDVQSLQIPGFWVCFAANTHFSNFAFQVQVHSITGDAAAVYFRFTTLNHDAKGYRFFISTSGEYRLEVFLHNTQGHVLQENFTSAIQTQQGQTNEITVIAKGSLIVIYVNQQYVTGVSDSAFGTGEIGVGAGYLTVPTEATFSNAKVWTL